MEREVYDLKVDPELSKVTPPLTEFESENLKNSILENGCRVPLMVWDGIIIDGHNRYRICKEYNVPFAIDEVEFADKDEAVVWIIENQLYRRNLQPFERIEMVARYEDKISREVARKKRQRISDIRNGNEVVQLVAQSERTRDIAANLAGVSHTTYVRGKWLAENADEPTKEKLRQDQLKITSAFKKLQKKPDETETEEETTQEDNSSESLEPVSYIDHPTEDPVTVHEPERKPLPYQFVKEQVEFAVRNMIADMKIGVYGLRNEDFDRKKELKNILKEGYKQAAHIIDEMEKIS